MSRLFSRLFPVLLIGAGSGAACAEEYRIDPAHSFLVFRVSHLDMSWTYGQFRAISGEFNHDPADPAANRITVTIDTASVDTNHAKRDEKVREGSLRVAEFPEAIFESTAYRGGDDKGVMAGTLTLLGVSQPIEIEVTKTGEGKDPWGGYRAGFSGRTALSLADWGIGAPSRNDRMEFDITIEGVRQ